MSAPSHTILYTHSPLWMRAPSRNEDNQLFSDFMMLIPKLNQCSQAIQALKLQQIKQVIEAFKHVVVYVDVNTKLNVLWVSHQPIPGVSRPIIAAIMQQLPEAKIVGSGYEPEPTNPTKKPNLLQQVFKNKLLK